MSSLRSWSTFLFGSLNEIELILKAHSKALYHLGFDCTVDNVCGELERLLQDSGYRESMIADYRAIRGALGGSGASRAVARAMIDELKA